MIFSRIERNIGDDAKPDSLVKKSMSKTNALWMQNSLIEMKISGKLQYLASQQETYRSSYNKTVPSPWRCVPSVAPALCRSERLHITSHQVLG